jgi:hypothetical protein
MKKLTLAISAMAMLIAAPAVALQDPPPATRPPAQEDKARDMQARGELVKVDAEAKTLSIKSADGAEMTFAYNDSTQVTGAQEGVAGLATKAGTRVTVHYTSSGATKTATKIEVQGQR